MEKESRGWWLHGFNRKQFKKIL